MSKPFVRVCRYPNGLRRWTRAWNCCSYSGNPWSGPYRITRNCTATRWRTGAAGRSSNWSSGRTARWTPITGRLPCPRTTTTFTGGWTCSHGNSCSWSTATGWSPTRCRNWTGSRRSWASSTGSVRRTSTSTGPRGSIVCGTTRWTSVWRRPRAADTRTSIRWSCPSSGNTSTGTTRSCTTCWARISGGPRNDRLFIIFFWILKFWFFNLEFCIQGILT